MTAPSGLLKWGQAGTFDAIDDRAVISALCNRRAGIVRAPTLAASTGLNVIVGPWQAIVDCGDGTFAVIGTTQQSTVTPAAGGASARTDIVWADISPDAATWTVNLRTSSDIVGRLGVQLGTITVPAGANLATAFTLTPATRSYDPFSVGGLFIQSGTVMITGAANVVRSTAVTFPQPFAAAPAVLLQDLTGMSSPIVNALWPSPVTATGFTANNNRANTSNISVQWVAIGVRP